MKVVLGFSGGVDSAVSAVLLRQAGYEVHGLYLDNTDEKARDEAESAAVRMGIEFEALNVKKELEENVCRPFTDCYLRGETPNPCIICNPNVKFKKLIETADRLGAAYVATGHYARVENGALYKGMPANDQSYMLCRLTRAQLSRLVLPLGTYEKKQVRAMAEEFGLPAAHKPDSMEICFIPDKDYIGWLPPRPASPSRRLCFPRRDNRTARGHPSLHRGPAPSRASQRAQGVYLPHKPRRQHRRAGAVGRAFQNRGPRPGF